jgi:hypothetical protein
MVREEMKKFIVIVGITLIVFIAFCIEVRREADANVKKCNEWCSPHLGFISAGDGFFEPNECVCKVVK